MAKDKGIGKETLSDTQAPVENQEIVETTKETPQEQQNGVQTEKKEQQQENQEIVKYRTGYKMLITDFGTFSADENGYIYLTKEQYDKLMKK